VVENVQGVARINGSWIVPDVPRPDMPLPYITSNQTDEFPCISMHINTFNATRWRLALTPTLPIMTVYISGRTVSNPVSSNGQYIISQQLGFQSWDSYTTTSVLFAFNETTMNQTGVTIKTVLDVFHAYPTIPLDKVMKELPDWSAQMSNFLTKVTREDSFTIAAAESMDDTPNGRTRPVRCRGFD